MAELEISLTLITFSDLGMYRLRKLSAPPSWTRIFELRIFLRILKSFVTLEPETLNQTAIHTTLAERLTEPSG
jgi:hypothetical protein